MINSYQELHALSTPILQVSNPETTRIIKESHATMLNKKNPMIKPHSRRNDKSLVKETSDSRWADLVEEEEHAPTKSKLSPQAPIFVPSKAEVSRRSPTTTYDSDLGSEMFDEDDEDDSLDILFDKVAKDGDLSPRQQRSGSNKNKKKTHQRQHS
ncbi:hypothetical protein R3W88_027400 [Solanum pinnatisectum]|uniref:Uncharacterized protein n=1 Tax=Solanum pinnatisectum TaxID=50273 RepID=A0AAV9LG53_9SOLN|nr:hypothetical protein R3W88_027400 [Solanum pinnatisectum]